VLGRRGCALNMANQLKVEVIQNIRALKEQGWSQRRIARELGLDRETVRRHWKRGGDPKPATLSTPGNEGGEGPSPVPPGRVEPAAVDGTTGMGRPGLCDGFAALITGKLEQGLSAQRIHQDLQREVAFAGSYQSVKRFVRGLKEERPQRVWRIEVQPAEEAQVDFGLGAPVVEGAGGRRRRTWVFRIATARRR